MGPTEVIAGRKARDVSSENASITRMMSLAVTGATTVTVRGLRDSDMMSRYRLWPLPAPPVYPKDISFAIARCAGAGCIASDSPDNDDEEFS